MNSEAELTASVPFEGDVAKSLIDSKCGHASFGPNLKINYFNLSKSYFEDEIKESPFTVWNNRGLILISKKS